MKYPLKAANGDAGEFFVAYKIAKELGWPCRLFDIDIGIDAQVEILSHARESTGSFVALQVKASAHEAECRYVYPAQLEYWRSLEIPVFVVLVNLDKEQMFLHLIEAAHEYEATKGGRIKIPFDLTKDRFSKTKTAAIFKEAADRTAMQHIGGCLDQVKQGIEVILLQLRNVKSNPDPFALIECMERRDALEGYIRQAMAVSASLGNRGTSEIENCEKELSWTLYCLQKFMGRYMRYHYADKGDFESFMQESYDYPPEDFTLSKLGRDF